MPTKWINIILHSNLCMVNIHVVSYAAAADPSSRQSADMWCHNAGGRVVFPDRPDTWRHKPGSRVVFPDRPDTWCHKPGGRVVFPDRPDTWRHKPGGRVVLTDRPHTWRHKHGGRVVLTDRPDTWRHKPGGRVLFPDRSVVTYSAAEYCCPWPGPNYTACSQRQRQEGARNLPKVFTRQWLSCYINKQSYSTLCPQKTKPENF